MPAEILILSDSGFDRGEGAIVVGDREEAAIQLGSGALRAICLDRRQVALALSDVRWLRRRRNRLPVFAIVDASQVSRAAELLTVGVEEIVVRGVDSARALRGRLDLFGRRDSARCGVEAAESVCARSPAMRACLDLAAKAQRSDATVLLQGETGTGKELLARILHRGGPRVAKPFVAINCAAFPETLLESELFGHERGAFTGADRARRGHFEEAHGGTLFLDEIGETSLGFQVKLLRALQEGVIRPVGSERERKINVRIIAATNRDLHQELEAGRFRRDLYYRIHVLPIHLPPLRSRIEDVVPLVDRFLANTPDACEIRAVAPDAARLLEAYAWPGNVRELENEVARVAACFPTEPEITARMLSPCIQGIGPALPADGASETLRETIARLETWVLRRALEQHAGRRIATARSLGITRECLYKKLRRYGLQ